MSTPSATGRPAFIGVNPNGVGVQPNQGNNFSNSSAQPLNNNNGSFSELAECLRQPYVDRQHLGHILQNTTVLDLRGHDIGEKGLETLCDALKSNHSVTTLVLDDIKPARQMNWKGMRFIAAMLGINNTIKTLSLQNNSLNDVAASSLLTGLIEQRYILLEKLVLNRNQIQSQTLECLGDLLEIHPTLTQLFFDGNKIDGDVVKILTDVFAGPQSSLKLLSVANNRLTPQDKTLLYASVIRCNNQSAADAQQLGILPLKNLSLIVDTSLHFLSFDNIVARSEQDLALVHKAMSGVALSNTEFATLVNLCFLLPPVQLKQLLRCTPAVDFSGLRIEKQALKAVLQELGLNKMLTSLTLRNITPALNQDDVPAIVGIIKSSPSIINLDLGQNEIGSLGAIRIISALSSQANNQDGNSSNGGPSKEWQSSIKYLSLEANKISPWTRPPIYEAISGCSNLIQLDLRENNFVPHMDPAPPPAERTAYEPMSRRLAVAKQMRKDKTPHRNPNFKSHPELVILTQITAGTIGIHKPPRTDKSSQNVDDQIWKDYRYQGVIPVSFGDMYEFGPEGDPIAHIAKCTLEDGQSGRLPFLIKEANVRYLGLSSLNVGEVKEFTQYFLREKIEPQSIKILTNLMLSFAPEAWSSVETMQAFLKALPPRGELSLKIEVTVYKDCETLYPRFVNLLNVAGCEVETRGF
ncbi:hypothetical protein [Hydrogenophaga sp.]|uniref:hypothetical protein n=1 Tax=Hydrogenophaga sp. TaxID=1904254 RepID=UPI00271DC5FE|nr:hypothetical protein [Hydrogenophaga sp.]MDO9434663.1 hypothetical protein [Hydrogenophaga sp.]